VSSHRNPLVIIPGLGGSVLEAKLHHRPRARDCSRNSDWYTIWASIVQGATRYDCFRDNLQLYTNKSSTYGLSNYTGVSIRPRDYGGTGGIEYSNAGTNEPPIAYMHELVKRLKDESGYVSGVSVRAATNDFRIVGNAAALDYEYAKLKDLIEETFQLNNGSKVHLLSHSLGGPLANLFLTTYVNHSWKETFIASHIMLSAVLLGSPVAIYAALSGPRYDYVPQFLPSLVVPLIRTFPSIIWMWPRISAEGKNVWSNEQFVVTPSKNYSLTSLKELTEDVTGATILYAMWDEIANRTKRSASDPFVKVLCLYANDTRTDLSIKTVDTFDAKGTTLSSTWGDGTVSLRSLEGCKSWSNVEVRPIEFGGSLAAHTEIVQNQLVISKIINWLAE
jgi:lysophospholipase-3